jgi:formylglycine-generating enzyme
MLRKIKYAAALGLTCTVLLAQAQVSRTGKDYAVFFYATDFKAGLDDLPYTKTETEELHKTLKDEYGFECHYVPECTKKKIEDELDRWNKKLRPGDQVLFYFSMHGYYSKGSDRGFLIPADGDPRADQNYYRGWLSYDELRTLLEPCKATHVLVALDACNSGSFGIRSTVRNVPDEEDYKPTKPDCASVVAALMKHQGRQFIAAAKAGTSAPGQSVFASTFIKTLRTGFDDNSMVLYDDLEYRLHKLRNPEPESGTFVGHSDGGDFVFLRRNACSKAGGSTVTTSEVIPKDPDLQAIERARKADTEAEWQNYLDFWPKGRHRAEAQTALARKQEEGVWKTAQVRNTTEAYQYYYDLYCPSGTHCTEASEQLKAKPDNMVFIKGGTFQMGSSDGESNEQPVHEVRVSDFFMGKYEVTVAEFRQFVEAENYKTDADKDGGSYMWTGSNWEKKAGISWQNDAEGKPAQDNYPVLHISWDDATVYCAWLSRTTGKKYRLPTEAEWEYAAKGGANQKWAGTNEENSLYRYANYNESGSKDGKTYTSSVGSYQPNPFGLYDMSGNVWEWCSTVPVAAPFPHIATHVV